MPWPRATARRNPARRHLTGSLLVLDLIFIGGIIALIALIAVIARGVEKL